MNLNDFLARLLSKLEGAGIPYMVVGSLGSSFHGRPRATNDIDVVIDPTEEQLSGLLASFGEAYYFSPEAAREALVNRSMFNVIDLETGSKADLIVRKDRPFSHEELRRRRPVRFLEIPLVIASPEDTILTKLEWSQITESERQVDDALGVVDVQWDKLDMDYLRRWGQELGVAERLEGILREAEKLHPPAQ